MLSDGQMLSAIAANPNNGLSADALSLLLPASTFCFSLEEDESVVNLFTTRVSGLGY